MRNVYRTDVPIGRIDLSDTRFKFRRNIREAAIEAKAESMTEIGLLNPVKLWRRGDKYTIISGWQRTLAAIKSGQDTISADVYEDITPHDALLINIADNNLREGLSDYEVACQMQSLKESYGYSVEQIAEMFHCGIDRVYSMLSVFDLDEAVRDAFAGGLLSLYRAVIIGRFPDSERSEMLALTLREGRSVSWLRGELTRRKRDQSVGSDSGGSKRAAGQPSPTKDALPKGRVLGVYPAKVPSVAGLVDSADSKPEQKVQFPSCELYDEYWKYYPEEVLDECWNLLPSDDARVPFFPWLYDELWKVAKKRGEAEAFIAAVKRRMGLL